FVMLSLGYSNKKGGYSSRVLGKVLGGRNKTQGHKYEGSSIIEGMGGIETTQAMIDTETARVEEKRTKQDAHVDGINAILSKHVYGNDTPPSEEEILAELNANDPNYNKNKGQEIPDNLGDIMKAWEEGKDVEPVYHKKGHPHGV
ncbi:MAG: hypothetical protein KAJ56_02005, partial [Candidatus Aenigmarchaeota archaeon]|nr:hypothetical protein [Candidatus Aenigmarchaeota archaeon]